MTDTTWLDEIVNKFKDYCRPEQHNRDGVSSWANCLTQGEAKTAILTHVQELIAAAEREAEIGILDNINLLATQGHSLDEIIKACVKQRLRLQQEGQR